MGISEACVPRSRCRASNTGAGLVVDTAGRLLTVEGIRTRMRDDRQGEQSMKRLAWGVALVTLVVAGVVGTRLASAADKVPTIKEVMTKLNKPGGLRPNLGEDLQADEPDWSMIQT